MMVKIEPDLLLKAYSVGLFPMAEDADSKDIFWCDPPKRGLIFLDKFHIPKKLKKQARQHPFHIRINYNFYEVMEGCAESSVGREKTWINTTIKDAYLALYEQGYAHSVECRDKENRLMGGLYGVSLGGAFFGESMFSRQTNASKIALIHLVARLHFGGYMFLDTQFVTSHLQQFGTQEIEGSDYRALLSKAMSVEGHWIGDLYSSFEGGSVSDFSSEESLLESFLQSTIQIS